MDAGLESSALALVTPEPPLSCTWIHHARRPPHCATHNIRPESRKLGLQCSESSSVDTGCPNKFVNHDTSGRPVRRLGIDIWHGDGAPACSSRRSRSLHPSGWGANRDRSPSAPDQRFPKAPHGPWFASQTAPAGPNALKCPATASQHAAKHNDAPRDRPSGSQRTPNRRSERQSQR